MEIRSIHKGDIVNISSRRGKPIITKGFVTIQSGSSYMGCNSISEEVLYRDFEWKGK